MNNIVHISPIKRWILLHETMAVKYTQNMTIITPMNFSFFTFPLVIMTIFKPITKLVIQILTRY